MKSFHPLLVVLVCVAMISCSDTVSTDVESLTVDEAIDIIESSLSEESAGLLETVKEYTEVFMEEFSIDPQCNATTTDSYSFMQNGSLVQAEYNFNWENTITCNGLSIPQSASFLSSGAGTYRTQRIASEDSSRFSTDISGLQPAASAIEFSGNYTRLGSQEITINQTVKNVETDLRIDLSDLVLTKSENQLTSGSGEFTLVGEANGEPFSIVGTIVFNDDRTATVSINGDEYRIDFN